MAKRHAPKGSDTSKVTVKLKPVMGMEPGLYLTLLYAFILLLIIFLFLFLPGIRHWGSEIAVGSTPPGAAVYIDGKYVGASPVTVFVPAGTRSLAVRKPFYTAVGNKITVRGRLFGSLFVPRRERLSYNLEVSNLPGLLAYSFRHLSEWAMIDQVLPNYQLPPIIQNTVSGALESAHFSDRKALWSFLKALMGDVHNQYLLADFTKAVSVLAGSGSAATPDQLLSTLESNLELGQRYPGLVFWLAHSLPSVERKKFEGSTTYTTAEAAYLSRLKSFTPTQNPGAGDNVFVDGMRFVSVPGGSYIMGAKTGTVPSGIDAADLDFPHVVRVPNYYMLASEVTHAEYSRFVAAVPKWAPAQAPTLAKAGLATGDYLKGWNTYRGPDYPQDYVSYFAAQAFTHWLQTQLPAQLSGYSVRLPTAAEWERAARMNVATDRSVFHQYYDGMQPAGTGAPNSLGIRDLLGNLWEWTSNWYEPASYFLTSVDGRSSLTTESIGDAAEKEVRGGSWASSRDSVSYTTRGSQPPDWCTPYLGFRPIIVKG